MSDKDDPKDTPAPDDPDKGEPDKGTDYKAEAEKWKALARKHEAQAKANADAAKKLAEMDEADKTEAQKAADKAAAAEKRAEEAEAKALRYEVAADKGVPATLLSGSTREEMEERADALIAYRENKDDDKGKPPGSKPKEDLRGGGDPSEEPEEMDPRKLADMVPRY